MAERVLMKGNEAMAEAAIRAGCRHFFGYTITPQTEVSAYMSKRMPKIGGVYLQAESEVAAINMVLGGAAAGARVMTSSSSPGISLKTEGISYIAGSDLPCLIANVQRGGPGLGGIQPSQSDYWQATRAPGHGDLHALVFAPSTVQELVTLVFLAYDLAEKYRMPAIMLSDGFLGQMMEPVSFPERQVTPHEKPWAACGHRNRRPRNIITSLYLKPEDLEALVVERFARYRTVIEQEQRSEEYLCGDAEYVLVAFGAASRVSKAAVDLLRAKGIRAGLLRPITLWPFPEAAVRGLAGTARRFLVVEMNMGQMVDDVRLALSGTVPVDFYGRTGGMIPTPADIAAQVEKLAGGDR